MDSQKEVQLLYSIASEVERSLEMPVILFTIKDYATSAVDSLVKLRMALLGGEPADRILAIVSAFHFGWLQAVKEVEDFKYRARDTPRAHVLEAIDFTVKSVKNREINFRKFIETLTPTMTFKENKLMQDNLNCISGTEKNLVAALNDKYKSISSAVDQMEYHYKVLDETEELLDWVDMLHDNLAIQVSKFVDISCPNLTSGLSETLQQVINEVTTDPDLQALDIAKEFKSNSKKLRIRLNLAENADTNNILQKIKILEDRIDELKNVNSCAVLALKHKTIYLQQRIQSLENLKMSLFKLTIGKKEVNASQTKDIRIFNHLLPHNNRIRLVSDLLKLWTEVICKKPDRKSIITILSTENADTREQFHDEFGKFIIDFYGRKLYIDKEGKMYQLSFNKELVPLLDDDDAEHIYFYDEWGRYFINDKMQRIYKLHNDASEYCLERGMLCLVKEIRDGRDYRYDNLGRYYIDEAGKRIYCEDGGALYENDGFGNLVRIRNVQPVIQGVGPVRQPFQMEENLYLQRVVGVALRKCIARVMMQQPADPVQFLASCLEEYARCECERQRRMRDLLPTQRHASLSSNNESETGETTSAADPNLLEYQTPYLSDSFT